MSSARVDCAWNPSVSRDKRASSFAASMWRSRDASASARVRPGRLADLAVRPAPRGDPDPTGPIEIRLSLPVRRLARDRESTGRLVHDSLPPRCLWHAAPPVALLSDYRFESNPESNAPQTRTNAHRRLCTNALVRAISAVGGGRPWTLWRRWTGIEPAGRGSPVPTALKAAEPTRYPDTSW